MKYFDCTPDFLSNHARICQVTSHFVAQQRERITCPIYDDRYPIQCELKYRTQSQIYSLGQNIRAERRRTATVADIQSQFPDVSMTVHDVQVEALRLLQDLVKRSVLLHTT